MSTRGAKDRYTATQRRQFVEAFDKLAHDAEHAPRIGVRKLIRPWALEQLLVLRGPGSRATRPFFVFLHVRVKVGLNTHDVIAAIDVDYFTGNS